MAGRWRSRTLISKEVKVVQWIRFSSFCMGVFSVSGIWGFQLRSEAYLDFGGTNGSANKRLPVCNNWTWKESRVGIAWSKWSRKGCLRSRGKAMPAPAPRPELQTHWLCFWTRKETSSADSFLWSGNRTIPESIRLNKAWNISFSRWRTVKNKGILYNSERGPHCHEIIISNNCNKNIISYTEYFDLHYTNDTGLDEETFSWIHRMSNWRRVKCSKSLPKRLLHQIMLTCASGIVCFPHFLIFNFSKSPKKLRTNRYGYDFGKSEKTHK
jgi:hypothetical protein